MSFLTRAIGSVRLATKAHAPTIMVVSGVVAMGASVVVASKKTLKVESTLGPYVVELEAIQETLDNPAMPGYTEKNATKDRARVLSRTSVDMVKLYAVPGVLFIGGSCLVFGAHRIMLRRNATLALAFTGLKKAFDAYRGNVVQAFGPEADQGMLNGWKKLEVIDPETGKVEVVNTRDWDNSTTDPYNRVFGRGETSQWTNDLGVNKLFIENQLRMAQIRLSNQGYLYLSDVYEALGFPETPVSRVVGWKAGYNPDGSKDTPIIDVGLNRSLPDDWMYTKENAVYLDFNCQGLIVGGGIQKALERA